MAMFSDAALAQIGILFQKRAELDGGKILAPTARIEMEKQGVAVPYLAVDQTTSQPYGYYNDRQVVAINAGQLVNTTYQAEVGQRGSSPVVNVAPAPAGYPSPELAPHMYFSGPIVPYGSGFDQQFLGEQLLGGQQYLQMPYVDNTGMNDQPQPFAGLNVDKMGSVLIMGAFVVGIFKVISMFGGRK